MSLALSPYPAPGHIQPLFFENALSQAATLKGGNCNIIIVTGPTTSCIDLLKIKSAIKLLNFQINGLAL